MTSELSKIVGFVSLLEELDTSKVEPLAHPLDTQNVFRDDVPAVSLSTAEALQSAPRHDGECFLVPAVLGESGAA
jgi:aspartyl-tRNA(Asn)/glutamyl-tRNA(Gln) amidotransferase subunit C